MTRNSIYGARLTAIPPSHSRLYPSLSPSFNPFRRQSASPYTFHSTADGQLKEGDEAAFFIAEDTQSSEEIPKDCSPALPVDICLAIGKEARVFISPQFEANSCMLRFVIANFICEMIAETRYFCI